MTETNEASKPAPANATQGAKRKVRNPNRYKEDGTYDNKPLDINYFRTYYHTKGAEQVECTTCGYKCNRSYLYRHSKPDKCTKLATHNKLNDKAEDDHEQSH